MTPALALVVSLAQTPAPSSTRGPPLEIEIDACVEVDREELTRLLAVELHGVREDQRTGSKVEVTCTDTPDVVRITERRGSEASSRELDLRAAGQAARRARTRELSLLIAESLKAREEPPRPAPSARPATQTTSTRAHTPWLELAVSGGAEKYTGGYAQLGPTLSGRLLGLRPLLFEARFGGRLSPALRAPAGQVTTHAWLFAVGVGVDALPNERAAGLSLLARLECDWLFAEGLSESADTRGFADDGRAYLGSLALSGWVGLNERWRIVAEPSLVLPIRPLEFRDRSRTIASLSGLGAAASLGLSLRL